MYYRVYDPNGEPFDVIRDRADTLILEHGWTQTPPEPAAVAIDEDEEPEAENASLVTIKTTANTGK